MRPSPTPSKPATADVPLLTEHNNRTGQKRLLVSIHYVSPRFESEIEIVHEMLAQHGASDRLAMLVVPDYWNEALIVPGSPFALKRPRWSDTGVEMFVHRWNHLDTNVHKECLAAVKARHMTAGEGEFFGLDREASATRMASGKALIEDVTGRAASGFVAPAWLYGAGAREALGASGFLLAENHMNVWRPDDGIVLCKGPVITWASRSRFRIAASLLAARALALGLRSAATVRLAVHPGDAGVRSLRWNLDVTVRALSPGRTFARYADLHG